MKRKGNDATARVKTGKHKHAMRKGSAMEKKIFNPETRQWEKVESEYDKQAREFMEKTGTTFKAILIGHDKYCPDDKESRDIYQIVLVRGEKTWTFRFGQSLSNSGKSLDDRRGRKAPKPYDVLACITKYDPDTFGDFCDECGYDNDSIKAHKIYLDVQKEWKKCERMFGDVIEELREIS